MVPAESMAIYLAESFSEERVSAELADPDTVFILAEINGKPTGYAKLFFSPPIPGVIGPDPVKLWRLYTAAEWQGAGIGRALMGEAIRIAKERGGKTLWLTVNIGNARAIAFYEQWGFVVTGKTGFILGGVPQEDHIMEYAIQN